MMKILCTANTEAEVLMAKRLAKIISEDPELVGSTVTIRQEVEQRLPRINVGTIGHLSCGRIGLTQAIIEVLGRSCFDLPIIGHYTPKKMDSVQFANIRQVHTQHSRQEVKRFSLNPRVMKKQRGRRFR